MDEPSLIDDTGPRNRVETWMALVLTLACPLVYWVMAEHRSLRTMGATLLLAIIGVTIIMTYVEQKRAREQPELYRRGLALALGIFACVHLLLAGAGYAYREHVIATANAGQMFPTTAGTWPDPSYTPTCSNPFPPGHPYD